MLLQVWYNIQSSWRLVWIGTIVSSITIKELHHTFILKKTFVCLMHCAHGVYFGQMKKRLHRIPPEKITDTAK